MKILFLDIDGVINSVRWCESWDMPYAFGQMPAWQQEAERAMDPAAVELVNQIVDRTGCLVVLSSSWRKLEPLPLVTRMLRYRGFRHRLWAATPHVMYERDDRLSHVERGVEIDAWLRAFAERPRFAILDDNSDMNPVMEHLVQTDDRVGLTQDGVDRAVALLKE